MVYATRPDVCRVDVTHRALGIPIDASASSCRIMIARRYGNKSDVMRRFNKENKG